MSGSRFSKALDFIYNRQHFGIKLGLHNITRLCDWMDNPQKTFHSVHVAGTNGKGSTSSFIASILQAAGYRVGLLTSPHLADYRERIRVNGKKIPPAAIAGFVEKHEQLILDSQVTFFEVTTALAFWYFQKKKVDWAILEVGLGGRLDATNIIVPKVSVITNISLEHTNLLGKTIYKIAGEKGGIIKPGVPLVTGVSDNGNDAAKRFREICADRKAPAFFHNENGYDYKFSANEDRLIFKKGPFKGLATGVYLRGRHQAENGYLAARTAQVIKSQGFNITKSAVKKGLTLNNWPGRCMTVRKNPTVIIDVAHNREGFTVLKDTLIKHYPKSRFHFLLGMVEKKHGDECFEMIAPIAKSISTARIRNPRRDDPYLLISRLKYNKSHIRVYPSIPEAYKDLIKNCSRTDILIIAGSHFIMGELAPFIKRDGF
ncbi:MAG: bifunctional folylpolyglutamate synthase/dihydrofolate synthase [candidate division Zixibacteria bacterium]|nr:bifunctional folylpolyglutamate synthase/dihydrofolate synthase [candidate division Zixibacteria bacterium]